MRMVKRILRKILNIKELEYDGIRASELVKVESKWYDSYCTHQVIWEDIYNVYHLAIKNSDDSIKTLKEKFSLKDSGYSIYVKLRTPILAERDNSNYFHEFTLEEVKSFYSQVHETKVNEAKWQEQRNKDKIKEMKKNEIPNLKKSITKIMENKE
jgi:hypothetical protein